MSYSIHIDNPNPYPINIGVTYPEVWHLCQSAVELAWSPTRDIDFSDLEKADLPPEVRTAGAEWWSLRAWMEHVAIAYGAERLKEAVASHQPLEVKQQITNFINEELRHHEGSFRIAEALDKFHTSPRVSYMQEIIPTFHDENHERKLPFLAGLALNALFESMSGDLLTPRTRNAKFESIRQVCKLIDRDEARHVQFGRILLRYHAKDISVEDKEVIGQVFVKKLRDVLLRGVYSVINLPPQDRAHAGRVREIAAEWGLGASRPEDEVEILRGSLKRIREWVEPHGFHIPRVPELDEEAEAVAA
ncbi:hypothetical protein MIZ03_3847 [Rhodoferax lithotrophicus]|uniref:p-aminobenzoate N-oxygenase AurF n=1 Tax=Rhodoferax lithotrophicus TaxID=2798804 RepID=A0ABN6DA95_9BURK|nr:hypothetical protein [Rhodoferax sp. MIZ03]BCO28937.1 hypothetical protein MIZ03_3847 [Rhodoferax sp. MIZ03]